MSDEINKETFDHMVELAALELDEDEAAYLRKELNNQLIAIHELEAIPIDPDVEVTSHGVPYTPEISAEVRADEHVPFEDVAALLEQAPALDDGYIVVPDIPSEDLE